jgi:hypothetical protein
MLFVVFVAYCGFQHILCCVFVLFFFVLLPVSLDCPFFIAPSCCQYIDAGSIGLIFILAGFLGAVMAGILLDKTKMFK